MYYSRSKILTRLTPSTPFCCRGLGVGPNLRHSNTEASDRGIFS